MLCECSIEGNDALQTVDVSLLSDVGGDFEYSSFSYQLLLQYSFVMVGNNSCRF